MGITTAMFVQKINDEWQVFVGETQVQYERPKIGSHLHYGVYKTRGDALCAAHDNAENLSVEELDDDSA